MVESKLVELVVAGSSPVGHPTFFKSFNYNTLLGVMGIISFDIGKWDPSLRAKKGPPELNEHNYGKQEDTYVD
jgi:hypothetical protein